MASFTPATYTATTTERIHTGRPFAEGVKAEVERAGAKRVLLLIGATLEANTPIGPAVKAALGDRLVATYTGLGAHTPRDRVVAAAEAGRDANADLIVAVGGGSVIDGAKVVALALANDVRAATDLDGKHTSLNPDGSIADPAVEAPNLRIVAVPTTLSAAEFSGHAGCTDAASGRKHMFRHPLMTPRAIVLDPAAGLHTPEWLWLSSGIRAVDHAVEDLCSSNPHPFVDGTASQALKLLTRALPATHADPDDLQARHDAQVAAWLSMIGGSLGVLRGASHGIGRALGGAAGVAHGHTSCIMLPGVLRWNIGVNAERQAMVAEIMGRPGDAAADCVADLVKAIGQPGRLSEVGVTKAQLPGIAEKAMNDRSVRTNPRKIDGPDQVVEILETVL